MWEHDEIVTKKDCGKGLWDVHEEVYEAVHEHACVGEREAKVGLT